MQTQSVLRVHYCLERLLRVFVRRQPPPDALEHRGPADVVSRVRAELRPLLRSAELALIQDCQGYAKQVLCTLLR